MKKSQLVDLAKQFGMVDASMSSPVAGLKKFITQMNTNADSAIHFEDILVKAGTATGSLGMINETAGTHLKNMNAFVDQQRTRMELAGRATGLTSVQMAQFTKEILQVPGALTELTDKQKQSTGGLDTYTAVLRIARATGMDYSDMTKDMTLAVRDYNASIPEAITFTAQIAEIAKNANVQIGDVRNSLSGTAEAFKMFGAGAQGAAEIMNEYVGALKATGVSGAVASDIVGNMTNQVSKFSIAQSAFLSAQSGGPGGLMGAFRIDNLLKTKDGLKQVFDMTKDQMTKMMGPNLVSSKEAEQSPQAAAQFMKQITILQQGPLGQFARTRPEAERIIDAFKTGKSTDFKELSKDLKAPLDLGLDYQKQTATGIGQLVGLMRREGAGLAAGAALNTIQAGGTAGAGTWFANQNLSDVQAARAALTKPLVEAGTAGTKGADIGLINAGISAIKSIPYYGKSNTTRSSVSHEVRRHS